MSNLPGIELDRKVSHTVLGLEVEYDLKNRVWMCWHPHSKDRKHKLPKYSQNLDDAHRILVFLQDRKFFVDTRSSVGNEQYMTWKVRFFRDTKNKQEWVHGLTLPHAICLAAISLHKQTNIDHIPK